MPNKFEDQLRKIKVSRQFLVIAMLLFVCLLVWTFVSIITSQTQTTLSPDLQKLAQPLNPTLDRNVLEELSEKQYYSEEELRAFTIFTIFVEQGGAEQIVPLGFTPPTSTPTPSSSVPLESDPDTQSLEI